MLLSLLLILGVQGFAKAPFKAESPRDLIEKARQLLLQKERVPAISLLATAAQRETKNGNTAGAKALVGALEEISSIFILDKAQQSYELGLSLIETDPVQALEKFEDAARMETRNFAVEVAIIRMNIVQGVCSDAATKARTLIALNPYAIDAHLVLAQAVACLGDLPELRKTIAAAPTDEGTMYWDLLRAQEAFFGPGADPAREKLKLVSKADAQFPEAYYWQWKTETKQKADGRAAAEKYLSLCKNPAKGIYRKYLREPMTCRRITEVETYIKKLETEP